MKLGIVIPFIHENYIHNLLDDIFKNDGRPDAILLIDNRPKAMPALSTPHAAVEIYRPPRPLFVNEAWNYGIDYLMNTRKCDAVSVFNDDLILDRWFFWRLRSLMEDPKNQIYGVVVPETMSDPSWQTGPDFWCEFLKRREGWAFTIRAEVAKQLPPIPVDQLKTFCGDDWIFTWCERIGRPWAKMMGVRCFHFIGSSMKTEAGGPARAMLKNEKSALLDLI